MTAIALACGPYENAPSSVRAFVNRPELDFSNIIDTLTPTQEWSIAPEHADGRIVSYPTR